MASKPLKKTVKLSISKEGVEKITREHYHAPLRRQAPVSDEDFPTFSDIGHESAIDRDDEHDVHHGASHALLTFTSHKLIEENVCQSQDNEESTQMSCCSSPITTTGALSETDDTTATGFMKTDDSQMQKTYPCTPPVSKGRPRKHPFKPGKYECSYCGVRCSKPSVLEKHVRAHTNERPFPCDLCQLGFKTKSNLYKHEKSNTHKSKLMELQDRDPLEANKYIYRQLSQIDSLGASSYLGSFDESRSNNAPGSRMTSFDSSTSDALTCSPMTSFDNDLLVPTLSNDRGQSPLIKSPIPTTPSMALQPDSLNELMHDLQTTVSNKNNSLSASSTITEEDSNELSPHFSQQQKQDVAAPKGAPFNVGASLIMPHGLGSDAQEHSIIAYLKVDHGAVGGSLTLPLKIDPSVWRLCSSEPKVGGEDLQLILGTTSLMSTQKHSSASEKTESKKSLITSTLQKMHHQQHQRIQDAKHDVEQAERESSFQATKMNNNSHEVDAECSGSHKSAKKQHLIASSTRRGPPLQSLGKAYSLDFESPPPLASSSKLHRQALSLDISSESHHDALSALPEAILCKSSVKERLKDKILLRRSFSGNSPTLPIISTSPSINNYQKSIEKQVSSTLPSTSSFASSMNSSVPLKKRRMLGYDQEEAPSSLTFSTSANSPCNISQVEFGVSKNDYQASSADVSQHSHLKHNQANLRCSTEEICSRPEQTKSATDDAAAATTSPNVKSHETDDASSMPTVTPAHSSDKAILNILATYASVTGAPLVNTMAVSSVNTSSETLTINAVSASNLSNINTTDSNQSSAQMEEKKNLKGSTGEQSHAEVRIFAGGLLSPNDTPVYIRGRGRGKYKCEICSIRCQKPSMLRKHIRTHAEIRPYICVWCNFSFKTKGNLTKHMKSKQHSRLCEQLGMSDVPTEVIEQYQVDKEALGKQMQLVKEGKIDLEQEAQHDSGLPLVVSESDSESDGELVSNNNCEQIIEEKKKCKFQQQVDLDKTATSDNSTTPTPTPTENSTSAILQNLSKTTKAVSKIIDKAANLNLQQINELAPPNVNVFDIPQDKPLNLSSGRALVTVTSNGAAAPDCLRDFMPCDQLEHVEVEGQLRNNYPAHQEQPQEESVPPHVPFEDAVGHQHYAEARRAECGVCGHQIELNQLTLHLKTHAFAREPIVTTLDMLDDESSSQASPETGHDSNLVIDPRPFKCSMCVTSFRVQGHLSKHFRSKQHVRQLHALGHVESKIFELIEKHRVPIHEVIDHDTGVLLLEALRRFLGPKACEMEADQGKELIAS